MKTNELNSNAIPTGFPTIDKATGGLRPGQLMMIVGGPGSGKSTMLLNIAHNAWTAGARVLIITVDGTEDMGKRIGAISAMVPYAAMRDGTLNDSEKRRLHVATAAAASGEPIHYVGKVGRCTQEYIENEILNTLPQTYDLILVDNPGHAGADKFRDSRDQDISDMSMMLRKVACKYKLPIISVMQTARDPWGHVVEVLSNSDIILSLRAIDQQQVMASGSVNLEGSLIKHRDGPKVRFAIKANFERCKMQEIEVRAEEISVVEENTK